MKVLLITAAAALIAAPALAQSMGAMPGMTAEQHAAMSKAAGTVDATGQIKAVNAKAGTLTIHHGPIADLGWPAMTMDFKATPEVLKSVKAGQSVKFTLERADNQVVAIQPQ